MHRNNAIHSSLKYLQQFKNPNSRIVQWILALQENSFEVIYCSGDQNVVADALSRLPVTEKEQINTLEDYFDEEQFDPQDICILSQSNKQKTNFAQE